MKTATTDINETRRKVTVSILSNETTEQEKSLVKEFAKSARIPGFRPGKVPESLIKKRFIKELNQQLHTKIVTTAYQKALDSIEEEVYSMVKMGEVSIASEKDTEVEIIFDIVPSFDLPVYKGLEIEAEKIDVLQEEIDEKLELIENQRSSYEVIKGRNIEKGDFVRCSYIGTIDEKLVSEMVPNNPIYGSQKGTWEEAGSESAPGVPAIVKGLVGMSTNETKSFEETFAEKFHIEQLAGKTVSYSVTVEEIRERVKPTLNQDFFKEFEVDSLESLRNKIKSDLHAEKEVLNKNKQRVILLEKISESLTFPVPLSALEAEIKSITQKESMNLLQSGKSKEEIEDQKEKLIEDARPKAEKSVRQQLLLKQIAKIEKLAINQQEMAQYAYQEAYRMRIPAEEFIKNLKKDQSSLQRLQQNILTIKAIDLIVNEAKVLEPVHPK